MRRARPFLLGIALGVMAGCAAPGPTVWADAGSGSDVEGAPDDAAEDSGDAASTDVAEEESTHPLLEGAIHLAPEPQRPGDPETGRKVLLEGAYVGCGVPEAVYELAGFAGVPA